jgi:hypothetical protein
MTTYSQTARVSAWGATKGARRVSGLTAWERAMIREGGEVRIAGCPPYRGQTDRRIVESGGRFFTRIPQES